MQVAKIVVAFMVGMAFFFLASCVGNRITAKDAQAVDPQNYGSLEKTAVHDGYRLEEFMAACGAVVVFEKDGANITAECNGWRMRVETYMVESGLADPFWCTQVFLSREGNPSRYAFGHIEGAEPHVVSQPERVLVKDANAKPWRQRLEKAVLEDLIELMNSGQLLEDRDDPLEGLSFSYLETDPDGVSWEHQPNSEPKQVSGVSAVPSSERYSGE